MAAVALFEFPCPVPCAALGKFLRFVRALRAGIVFLDAVDFVVNKKLPASCAGRDNGLLWALPPGIGFSCSSKCRRVFAFPAASSKVRSLTSFFCFGIAAFAASSRSAAFLPIF